MAGLPRYAFGSLTGWPSRVCPSIQGKGSPTGSRLMMGELHPGANAEKTTVAISTRRYKAPALTCEAVLDAGLLFMRDIGTNPGVFKCGGHLNQHAECLGGIAGMEVVQSQALPSVETNW